MRSATLLVAAGALLAACHKQADEPAPEPRPVLSVVVGAGAGGDRPFVGTIEGRQTADVAFRVGGRVVRRAVSVGDTVKRGQILGELDRRALQLEVQAASSDVAGLVARRENASTDLGRQTTLLQRSVIARSSLDEAQATHAVAVASVDEASARLRKAREDLDYGVLRADFDGVVTRIDFEVEQVVTPNMPVAQIVSPGALDFVLDAAEPVATGLELDEAFVVYNEESPLQTTAAKVRQIAPAADRVTRTRRVWIALDKPPAQVRIGSTMYARRAVAGKPPIRVPLSALMEAAGRTSVWVVDKDVVRARAVTVGARTDQDVEIVTGLHDGERVVTAGVHLLNAEQRIKPSEEPVR